MADIKMSFLRFLLQHGADTTIKDKVRVSSHVVVHCT